MVRAGGFSAVTLMLLGCWLVLHGEASLWCEGRGDTPSAQHLQTGCYLAI